MATLSVSITTGATVTSSKTFSSADATRILTAYQNLIQPGGQPADMAAWMLGQLQKQINSLVVQNESVTPTPPTMT